MIHASCEEDKGKVGLAQIYNYILDGDSHNVKRRDIFSMLEDHMSKTHFLLHME